MFLSKLPYLDPGSGSFILQMVIAALLGAGLALRVYWAKIKAKFGGKQVPPDDDDEADNA